MLRNANLLAKIGADTAENEQHFADILPIGRRVALRHGRLRGPPRSAAPSRPAPGRPHGCFLGPGGRGPGQAAGGPNFKPI